MRTLNQLAAITPVRLVHCTVCQFLSGIYRISHRSQMQTEKSQPEGKRTMPETKFTEFPAFSVDLRVGTSRSASETDV